MENLVSALPLKIPFQVLFENFWVSYSETLFLAEFHCWKNQALFWYLLIAKSLGKGNARLDICFLNRTSRLVVSFCFVVFFSLFFGKSFFFLQVGVVNQV